MAITNNIYFDSLLDLADELLESPITVTVTRQMSGLLQDYANRLKNMNPTAAEMHGYETMKNLKNKAFEQLKAETPLIVKEAISPLQSSFENESKNN